MKQIMLNQFDMNTPGHIWPGFWRHPRDRMNYLSLDYWQSVARIAERGLIDSFFFADVFGVYDVYGSSPEAALSAGTQVPINDPTLIIPSMAAVTSHLGFGVTSNLSLEPPYILARRLSTLDHLTNGRIAWNIVTGFLASAARGVGLDTIQKHDDRYDVADEYMDVLYKLWEGSWADDAVVRDAASGVYTRPDRVRRIDHRGKYFRVDAIALTEPSPQRTPTLYQAGASRRGRAFSARHAETILISGHTKALVAETVADIRRQAKAFGRDPQDPKIVLGATIVAAPTKAEARDLYEDYRRHVDARGALTILAGWSGVDFSRYDLDEPIKHIDSPAAQSTLELLTIRSPDRVWTVRDLVAFEPIAGHGPFIIGSGAEVTEELIAWVEATGVDGFNFTRLVMPESLEAIVDLVVPELQSRGAYKLAYAEGTLRRKLQGHDRLPERHPAARFRWRQPEFA
ncbi:Dimethyl-sulfide monooxygenase [Mesorhizobium plurifarium]|uniref:Dimethyl-sulfide monooxygenase n=1 Tax=Mesorhizobium plurifarium TaxID=69974 RepID=A0A0K2VQF5_MESPL|nr:Dimethyl-sulfide monooxygenase [Mesorhizobium plurifarium]